MSTQFFKITFLFLLFSSSLLAQDCPPPGFPEPGNTCPEAPILCPDLDGYCATINNINVPQLFPCCSGAWILNNDEWFAFFAGTTTITIEIVPQNCTPGSQMGLQGGIYDACPLFGGCNAMDVQCSCIEDPFILTSNNYVVGQVYWIVLDGCNGNVCDYTVNVLEGSTVGFAPPNPGAIAGSNAVCHGSTSAYSIALVNGATTYNWTLAPSDAGTLSVDSDSVTVAWSDTFTGLATLCVATSNQCYLSANESCFEIEVSSDVSQQENISFCPGESVTIAGQVYNQSGTVIETLPSTSGCDTIVTYTLTLLPYPIRTESVSFCPGESVTISGQVYNQSGTVLDTIAATIGCDTLVSYSLTLLPQPTRAETIAFCPGETIVLGGINYTQPGSVILSVPSTSVGLCDTIVTYTLQFLTPAPSNVSINCPGSITLTAGSSGAAVNYSIATAASNCPCPGIAIDLTSGLASGSIFPQGVTSVCYTAADSCGQRAACCFNVTVEEDDDEPCDTKVNGCLKYELLTITEDAGKNRTYRIRVTNNCPSKLLSTAIQIPSGMVAIEPVNYSAYTAPSGNTYLVRNPNFTPLYSIRYSSISDSINNGESDIFKYTLPAQADMTFINVLSRLAPNTYLEAHLNTFYCPIGVTPTGNHPNGERNGDANWTISENPGLSNQDRLLLFPNPANQIVRAETVEETGELILHDAIGRVVLRKSVESSSTTFSVEGFSQGLYQVIFVGEKTMRYGALVVQH
ncbi:MAG: HYR domain-containing protein [Saprospiraceae bacterium]